MAKGFQANAERLEALRSLGKELARRSKSRCELCATGGTPLDFYEVPPAPEDPDPERTLLICADCRNAVQTPATANGQQWRCLIDRLWGDLPASQVVALRMLEQLAPREDWAREALEFFEPEPDLRTWADTAA